MNKDIGKLSAIGNAARKAKLTPEQLSNSARIAVKARWEKYRLRKSHVCGDLCKCKICGRAKYKHSKYSETKCEFECEKL